MLPESKDLSSTRSIESITLAESSSLKGKGKEEDPKRTPSPQPSEGSEPSDHFQRRSPTPKPTPPPSPPSSPSPPPSPTPYIVPMGDNNNPTPKISQPSTFSGKPRELEDFIINMELFFSFYDTYYHNQPERHIKMFLMHMNDQASEWRRSKMVEYDTSRNTADNKWNNYPNFLAELRSRFGEVLGSGRAQNALENMRKGKQSYSQWVGKKDTLIMKAGIIGNKQKIHALLKGLKSEDITRVLDHYQSGNREYADIMTYVQSLDTMQGLARLLAGSGQSS